MTPTQQAALYKLEARTHVLVPVPQSIASIPYDEPVLVIFSDGSAQTDFLYDQSIEEWVQERAHKFAGYEGLVTKPEAWMRIPTKAMLSAAQEGE